MARLLQSISSPALLHQMSAQELKALAGEIREEIIKTVHRTGGHLGASLGAVEIIIAIHSVINSPEDKVIFDVGHQAYAHKLLTGRLDNFACLRQADGLSGFPRRSESPHDPFGTGHAGTSISAALGYCLARDALGQKYKVVTVTGDGALTAGMAFEALNHAGELQTDLVVVLNDNEMSIAPNVGGLSDYLTRIRTDPTYHRAKDDLERLISRIPAVGGQMLRVVERLRDTVRSLVVPGAFFEELGFSYYGPIDGHNIPLLQRVLREAFERGGPVLIHAYTQKGRGYAPAESDPGHLHALAPERANGVHRPTFSQLFGETLEQLAAQDQRIVAITAAMPEGTGLSGFGHRFPDRLIDVGIAEQHAVTLAAGLACGGMKPVVAIYSSFMQRAYDQIVHDVALQNLPVVLCLDRAGLVGEDGPTHHGAFDISYLRHIPNLVVMAPRDGAHLRHMLYTALEHDGPAAIRYGREEVQDVGARHQLPAKIPIGRGELLRRGGDIAILAVGTMVAVAMAAAELLEERGLSVAVADARFIKPLDEALLGELARSVRCLVTVEDNCVAGGFGSAVLETLARLSLQLPVRCLGIPDRFIEHGPLEWLREKWGLHPAAVAEAAYGLWAGSRQGWPQIIETGSHN
ncbi:MAG TPA: 1-deoxy-D-xylulose-5-phosphate synthase [Firmicutes bacterium]|nr:1-deoxy-D-xylulose-5-phosphate synthase [Bacillota bacterium]